MFPDPRAADASAPLSLTLGQALWMARYIRSTGLTREEAKSAELEAIGIVSMMDVCATCGYSVHSHDTSEKTRSCGHFVSSLCTGTDS